MIWRVWASSGPNGSSISRIFGIADEHLREADALALAAGQHMRIAVGEGAEADAREPFRRAGAGFGRRRAGGSSPIATLSIAVFHGKQRIRLEQVTGRRLSPVSGKPKMFTLPAAGASRPAAILSSVDLPQPVGPTIATNSPSPTLNVARSTAV